MPRKIDHEQRRQDILREALELFSSQGYEATTLADIAKAAGIARPTLYQYFRNKHQLLFFASKQFTDEFLVYYHKIVELKELAALHRLRFILSHIVLSCREKRRELVSQSSFILKLEQEGRSIGELVHKRTRPLKNLLSQLLKEAELGKQLCSSDLLNAVDLLLTLVTSGIVHVLLFPAEDCDPTLQHIATVLSLLAERAGEQESQSTESDYNQVHRYLLAQVQQMREQNALEKARTQSQHKDQHDHSALSPMDDYEDENDDEWLAFLDPFRNL